MATHAVEIAQGERFQFGENWRRFLEHLDEHRIANAEESLRKMLEVARPDRLGRRLSF
jgi:heme oxygenase